MNLQMHLGALKIKLTIIIITCSAEFFLIKGAGAVFFNMSNVTASGLLGASR